MNKSESDFVITDYSYHKQVINLVKKAEARVICLCSLESEEAYDPNIFFVTNNFQEIVSEIAA
jgi:hypothetical protein